MTKSIKQKAITGLTWSFADNIINKGLQFVVGIILARLLSPAEFGLIGMITVFIAISQIFIDSGFGQSLVRKKVCEQKDYCTVFYFNLSISFLLYIILFFSASSVSSFFNQPELKNLLRVLSLILIINAATLVQRTILTRDINFKLQAKISFISSIVAGIIGIVMAYKGFGVWSLVFKTLVQNFINSLLLWTFNHWKPTLTFSKEAFKEMFQFGYKLLLSSLLYTTYRNIYYLIIGKFFNATELGLYTRAENFQKLPSSNLTDVIQRVSYPILAKMQDEPDRLKIGYKKMIKSSMLLSFVLMIGMAATAKSMVLTLIGSKWLPSVFYLEVICFAGMLYPLHALNLNMLNVKGRSDLFLRLEIIKIALGIPTILAGIFFGMKFLVIGIVFNSFIAYYFNSLWSGKLMNYSVTEQIKDILPSFIVAITMGAIVYVLGLFLPFKPIIVFSLQIVIGALFVTSICKLARLDSYMELREIVIDKFYRKKA